MAVRRDFEYPIGAARGVNGYRCGHSFHPVQGSNSSGYSFARRDAVPQPLIQFFAPPSILMPRRGSNGRRGPYRSGTDGLCEKNIECADEISPARSCTGFLLLRLTLGLNICMHSTKVKLLAPLRGLLPPHLMSLGDESH